MSELSSLYSHSPCCLLEQLQGGNSQPAQQSAHHQGAGVYKGSHRETEPASQYLPVCGSPGYVLQGYRVTALPQESFLICVDVTGSTHSHLPIPNISVQTESSLCNLLWAPLVTWVNLDSALRGRDSERPGSLVHRWLLYRLSANFWHPLHCTLEAEVTKKHLFIPQSSAESEIP